LLRKMHGDGKKRLPSNTPPHLYRIPVSVLI